ncbi:MAG: hypothetical protein HOP16_16310, partial [Acidobacteria bacterium]|nr:hypothetical protein [Acidobacteriota bacterium]
MAIPRDARVEDALREVATAVTYEGGGTWTLSSSDSADMLARAHMSAGWLTL